ncbi:hypothetical protein FRX31_005049 [Thalictrum thalictroides]|nr:hypothetical protein FRX31_005049 [Thalictrum thalictroides]
MGGGGGGEDRVGGGRRRRGGAAEQEGRTIEEKSRKNIIKSDEHEIELEVEAIVVVLCEVDEEIKVVYIENVEQAIACYGHLRVEMVVGNW